MNEFKGIPIDKGRFIYGKRSGIIVGFKEIE